MTDSVSKNLNIKKLVAEALQSNHKSYHLCKSHIVKAFYRSDLDVLATAENQLKFREKLTAINPTNIHFDVVLKPLLKLEYALLETSLAMINLHQAPNKMIFSIILFKEKIK